MKRKYKSLVTLYHDYDSECVGTMKPQKDGDLTPEYAYGHERIKDWRKQDD